MKSCCLTWRLVLIRPLYEMVGSVADARFKLKGIEAELLEEMSAGYRPTHRGHPWSKEMFDVLTSLSLALEVAFDLAKAIQFPETLPSRLTDAHARLRESLPAP